VKCQFLKTTIVTTHFKKLTTGNNVFIVSVINVSFVTVMSCSFYIKCSVCIRLAAV